MGIASKLMKVEGPLTKDLAETTISFRGLGRKYGVSRQAISNFWRQKEIIRPVREHIPEKCSICQGLIEIAKEPYSDFVSSQTMKEKLGIRSAQWRKHIRILRKNGVVSQQFGRLHSKRAELAYQIYFEKKLPVIDIGRQVGLKNFHSVMRGHRGSGWDIPYLKWKRSKAEQFEKGQERSKGNDEEDTKAHNDDRFFI
jgi:biotin operon repressor